MSSRFTIDGSDALELRLEEICATVRDEVVRLIPTSALDALILGGGYGRGEGGVLSTSHGDRPYNDVEFYLLLGGRGLLGGWRYSRSIHAVMERLSHKAGVEVELKVLPTRKLEQSGVTMFYYDLVSGHRLVFGTDAWLDKCDHHRAAHRIPLHEATRLLMNRCSGLLYADERLERNPFTAEDADFVGRNLAKAKLALGDVLLTMRGQYHWSCRERQKRLTKLADIEPMLKSFALLHEQGVQFKLHPVRTTRAASELRSEATFVKELAREVWLSVESRRLGRKFSSLLDYSFDLGSKCPETDPMKNRLINVRTFGTTGLVDPTYPRERLLRSLPLLLWERHSAEVPRVVGRNLQAKSTEFRALVGAYQSLWKDFN